MKSKNMIILAILLVILLITISLGVFLINFILTKEEPKTEFIQPAVKEQPYNPQINPSDFTTKITNKYLTFTPGTKFTYKGKTEDGTERTEVYVTNEEKIVMGVKTLVVWDRVWLNDELIEDTKDWYAQDKYGNVWYFGEDSKELVKGKVVSREGSWEAGVNGAKPGIVMKANPQVGESYRQEYYKGEAEDMADVVSLGVKIKVNYGEFTNCLQTRDWTPLEPDADEYKYYCPELGNVVYEVGVEDGEGAQLIDVKENAQPTQDTKAREEPEEIKTEITEAEAIAIAKSKVDGDVTDVAIEQKYGKAVYAIEIYAEEETDVYVDIETGKILGIET